MTIEQNEQPGQFMFRESGRELFRITADGDVILNDDVSWTDAAKHFWQTVNEMRENA